MLNKNIGIQNMLKIIEGGEHINKNNEKVAQVTLEDKTVWTLTDYMYVDWDEFTQTTHEELIECGWEKRNLTTLQNIQNYSHMVYDNEIMHNHLSHKHLPRNH